MANVQPPPITRRSPLWGLSFKVETIAGKFNSLASDVRDIWLLGQWLYLPFYWVSYYLTQAVIIIRDGDTWVAEHRGMLESLFNGSKFSEILNQVSATLAWIRADPLGWLRVQIQHLSNDLIDIIINARSWIRNKIQEVFPQLVNVNDNPHSWIRTLLQQTFGLGAQLLIDPFGTIRNILTNISPFLGGLLSSGIYYIINQLNARTGWFSRFINNPTQTIKEFLKQSSGELDTLITSPLFWVKDKISNITGLSITDLNRLPSQLGIIVLEKIKGNIQTHRNRLTTLVSDIIMMFM